MSGQSRPDVAVQTSLCMQKFPEVKMGDLVVANQLVHRIQQHADIGLHCSCIPVQDLTMVAHSDASLANASNLRTQGGYILAFTTKALNEGTENSGVPAKIILQSFGLLMIWQL